MNSVPVFSLLRNRNFYIMLLGEAGLFALALFVAYGLRFEFEIPGQYLRQMLLLLPASVLSKLVFFGAMGLYRGMWRYTGLADLWRIARAIILAEICLVLYTVFVRHFQGYPRSVFILDSLLSFVFACGARVFIRSMYEISSSPLDWILSFVPFRLRSPRPGARALIVGADDEAARMAKEILGLRDSGLHLVGFVDDDASRIGRRIHDLPVFGPLDRLTDVASAMGAEEVLVSASRSITGGPRHIMEACEAARVRVKKLPALADIANGRVSIKALRDVRFEDLLGRAEVHLDVAGIQGYLRDKVVLVTGAGGSIGAELCRQILRFGPRSIVLYDAGEANLYGIEMELKHEREFDRYVPILGQVQDEVLLDQVFARHRPQVVFHAAAYKHVPMLELNPWQAVTNNIVGSQTVMEAAVRFGAERFVLVSTDKAVRPTNVMGASKRVAELIMRGMQGGSTAFMAVRFGNVLGSSGSVIPLFRRQIGHGGPVTVTHPEVTRYFMTIPEAAQLIVQAGALGRGGEIFLLKMGQPVRIADLARDLIVLSGKDPAEIEIRFTGLRPGEKLYEELITAGEGVVQTGHDKIMVLEQLGLTPARPGIETLVQAAQAFDGDAVRGELARLVPEYCPARTPVKHALDPAAGR